MKEITRIMTVQITTIEKLKENTKLLNEKQIARRIKANNCADDVQVLKVQDFIMDKE